MLYNADRLTFAEWKTRASSSSSCKCTKPVELWVGGAGGANLPPSRCLQVKKHFRLSELEWEPRRSLICNFAQQQQKQITFIYLTKVPPPAPSGHAEREWSGWLSCSYSLAQQQQQPCEKESAAWWLLPKLEDTMTANFRWASSLMCVCVLKNAEKTEGTRRLTAGEISRDDDVFFLHTTRGGEIFN